MLILVQCQSVLDPTGIVLKISHETFQIHLPTVEHLFQNGYCDSNLGSFSLWCSKLGVHVNGLGY